MEVKVLGSVSPYPKNTKNGVSFLVTISQKNKILLDLGPGSTSLLDMVNDLEGLTVIISHLHRDHYSDISALGYASYLAHNFGYLTKRIKVYIPKCEDLIDYKYLTNYGNSHYLEFIPYNDLNISINNVNITNSLNPHDIVSNSIKIDNGKESLVYSGDTGYKDNTLEFFACNTNLLICESTFIKGQSKNLDYHLFAYEAGIIAEKANAKNLMLTHFYPEIDKQKYVDEASLEYKNKDHIYAAEEGKVYVLYNNNFYKKEITKALI